MPSAVDFGTYAFTLACPAVEGSVPNRLRDLPKPCRGQGSHSAVAQHRQHKATPSGGIDCHLHHQQQRHAPLLKDALASSGSQGESPPWDAGGGAGAVDIKILDLGNLVEPPGGIPETNKSEDTGVQLRRSAASALLVLAAGKRTADDGRGAESSSSGGGSARVIHGLPLSEAGENQDRKRVRANNSDCNPIPTNKEKERRFAVARRAREGRVWWDDMCDVLREDCEKRGLNSDKHLQYQIANFRPMAQSECIMRFLHVSHADGHIREMETSQSKESALGWLSLQVDPSRATEFYDGLLRMFNIEPAGGISCTGVPGRGLLGRQAKTLLTALTRFGLKPDARGGGKWEKGYRGDVPFIYHEHKGRALESWDEKV